MWQTNWVADRLRAIHPDIDIEIHGVISAGDKNRTEPLPKIGGKGLFTQELDEGLLNGEIDLAVHSLKDLPTTLTKGLALAAVPEREDCRDVFIGKGGMRLADLPEGSVVGSSSVRRRALLLSVRPDLQLTDIRGNVDTRLRRVEELENLHGTLLAYAGLHRLGRLTDKMEVLDPTHWTPAVSQGALGVVTNAEANEIILLLGSLDHNPTRLAVTAERALLGRLEGGCHVPIGAHASVDGDNLEMDSVLLSLDGKRVLRDKAQGTADSARALGVAAAERLLTQGGDEILAELDNSKGEES